MWCSGRRGARAPGSRSRARRGEERPPRDLSGANFCKSMSYAVSKPLSALPNRGSGRPSRLSSQGPDLKAVCAAGIQGLIKRESPADEQPKGIGGAFGFRAALRNGPMLAGRGRGARITRGPSSTSARRDLALGGGVAVPLDDAVDVGHLGAEVAVGQVAIGAPFGERTEQASARPSRPRHRDLGGKGFPWVKPRPRPARPILPQSSHAFRSPSQECAPR